MQLFSTVVRHTLVGGRRELRWSPAAESGRASILPFHLSFFNLTSASYINSRDRPTKITVASTYNPWKHDQYLIGIAKPSPIHAHYAVYLIHARRLAKPKRRPGSSLQKLSACSHTNQLIRYPALHAHDPTIASGPARGPAFYCIRIRSHS